MKIKRMVKRLFAVGAGVTMLGATAMGALAADLNQYPSFFVENGVFNGLIVVGERAAAVDNLAATDIAVSMKVSGASATTTTTVTGDAWKVGTSSKFLELAANDASDSSNDGETVNSISTFIGDDELQALADGKWTTNENEFTYQQFLYFDNTDNTSHIVKYGENDEDVTGDHFLIKSGKQIARYRMEFSSTAQSDVTDSAGTGSTTGTYLDDFEDTSLSFLGKEFTVVQARRPAGTPEDSAKLILMAGATKDTLLEGETKSYTVGGKTYDVTLSYVDSSYAKFTVNGEATNKLQNGETYVLSDKTELGVSEVLYQSYAGGIHSATFYIGAQKWELRDDVITNSVGTYNLKVGSEDIDGTTVIISGTDDNTTFTVSTIEINMSAGDDFFVPANGKLSEIVAAAGEEKEVLMGNLFDVEYKGLSDEETHEIKLKTSSTRKYQLVLFDGDGNAVDIPVAYAEAEYNLTLGDDSAGNSAGDRKALVLNETTALNKNDFFVVTSGDDSSGAAKSYLLQYKGSDASTKTSPKIKFKNLGSGENLEYSVSTSGTIATLKLGGYSFTVQNVSAHTADDFTINVALNGDGDYTDGALVNFIDSYGSRFAFTVREAATPLNSTSYDSYVVTQTFQNANDYDSIVPTTVVLNITATSGPEVRVSQSGLTLLTPSGETEVSYGYNTMGDFITLTSPSGDPQEFTSVYPKDQKLPQLYFTSGATTTSATATGDLVAVKVVDATKLDSEVSSATAQNLVVVGGPCVNTVAASLLGNPADCTEGFRPGVARVKLFENAGGTVAMLVAGYSGADTRLAGQFIAHRWRELSGSEVEIEGTTYNDATVSAPAPRVAAAAPAAAETTGTTE